MNSKDHPKTPSSRNLDPITRDMILSLGVDPDAFESGGDYDARTNISGDIKAVADVAVAVRDKYRELDAKYPVAMEVAMLAAPIILTGGAGLIWTGSRVAATSAARYAVSGIATSHLIKTVAGDEIGSALGKVHETVASSLENVSDLNPDQSSALASGVMLGVSVALDVKSGVHAATSYKMKHTRDFGDGHKETNSVFFNKSYDDIGVASKPTLHDHQHPSGEVISVDRDAMKSKGWVDSYKDSFPSAVEWEARLGTKQTYKVHQRGDIDWDHIRTGGDFKFIGKTNREAALYGIRPQLEDGNFVSLHHIGQNALGPLTETSTKLHHFKNKQAFKILHNQFSGKKHPEFPVNHGSDWKADVREYWKWRINNAK